MALIRAVLLLLFSMFLAFRKAVLLLLFGMFLALKRAVWYTAGYQCVLEFNVTGNEISVIYVTAQMCRRTEEEVVPTCTVGLPAPSTFCRVL